VLKYLKLLVFTATPESATAVLQKMHRNSREPSARFGSSFGESSLFVGGQKHILYQIIDIVPVGTQAVKKAGNEARMSRKQPFGVPMVDCVRHVMFVDVPSHDDPSA
jgi:hypothetical protein